MRFSLTTPTRQIGRQSRACRLLTTRGFTLVELLLTIIIMAVLAAVAVPRFVNMGTEARVATVKTMASVLRSTTENYHAICPAFTQCDYTAQTKYVLISGNWACLNYGWICGGSILNSDHIDGVTNYAGFTASVTSGTTTLFTLDGSPNPQNCSVSYDTPYDRGPAALVLIVTTTSGC